MHTLWSIRTIYKDPEGIMVTVMGSHLPHVNGMVAVHVIQEGAAGVGGRCDVLAELVFLHHAEETCLLTVNHKVHVEVTKYEHRACVGSCSMTGDAL